MVPSFFSNAINVARSDFERPWAAQSMACLCVANTRVISAFPSGVRSTTRAPVAGVRGPGHQTTLLEPIDGRGNRTARELDAPADLTDRLRSLVEQHFKDREIRDAHVEGDDAPRREAGHRPVRLHEHEPDANAGAVG